MSSRKPANPPPGSSSWYAKEGKTGWWLLCWGLGKQFCNQFWFWSDWQGPRPKLFQIKRLPLPLTIFWQYQKLDFGHLPTQGLDLGTQQWLLPWDSQTGLGFLCWALEVPFFGYPKVWYYAVLGTQNMYFWCSKRKLEISFGISDQKWFQNWFQFFKEWCKFWLFYFFILQLIV